MPAEESAGAWWEFRVQERGGQFIYLGRDVGDVYGIGERAQGLQLAALCG